MSCEEDQELVSLVTDLTSRCNTLYDEVRQFERRLAELNKLKDVELRSFSGAIQSELRSLDKIKEEDRRSLEQRIHMLRSTNVTFYEAVWSTAKRSRGVTGFFKRFYWESEAATEAQPNPPSGRAQQHSRPPKKKGAAVDIVAEDGAEWIKLSTVTESRLLFELARQGWERNDDDSSSREGDSDEPSSHENTDSDADDDISILKAAKELVRASRATRFRYEHPRLRMVLPKITRQSVDRIDELLHDIESLGLEVHTADALLQEKENESRTIDKALDSMLVDEFANLTPTLNLDCTILLAIVSDLTNDHVEKEASLPTAARRQIEMEEERSMLPSFLLPAMGARKLLCTREAASRMLEIVQTIGTPTERDRTAAILPAGFVDAALTNSGKRAEERAEPSATTFAALSTHTIPLDWQLPVLIVDSPGPASALGLPIIADAVERELSALNRSVFIYGWHNNITTLTSNRTIVKRIQSIIETSLRPGEKGVQGPKIWLCLTARSLRAKDKSRK